MSSPSLSPSTSTSTSYHQHSYHKGQTGVTFMKSRVSRWSSLEHLIDLVYYEEQHSRLSLLIDQIRLYILYIGNTLKLTVSAMGSNSVPPMVVNPTPDDYLELQNPREEAPFTKYYQDLDPEELLPVFQYTSGKIFENILENSKDLEKYLNRQQRVDTIRQSKLKIPFFTRIDSHSADDLVMPPIQANSTMEKLGFFNINNDNLKNNSLPDTYIRPDFSKNELIRGKLMYNSKKFQVQYDMDETDLLFLNWVNEISKDSQWLSMELFEIIITFFEIQIYQIERLLPPTIKDRSTIDYELQQNALLYGSDDGMGCLNEDEQACAVCDFSDCDATNSIIFCDGCDIAVHQDCYGVSFIPEGPWLCRRCLIARNNHEKCIFCPSTSGAFKQTDSGDWAHVLCTLWTPELYFANPIYMEPIEGIDNIPKSRWKLVCYICKQKVGVCIQCSKPSCFTAYHVTCAKRASLFMKYKKGIKIAASDKNTLISYCDKHTPIEWGMNHDVKKGIEKTRLYFHDKQKHLINSDTKRNNEMTFVTNEEFTELSKTKSEKFKWRLYSNIYVIPNIIINKLIEFLDDNKLPKMSKLTLDQIAKYYTLKRKYTGKPLIKKPDMFNHASLPVDTLDNRINAVEYFQHDINKLNELSKFVMKRSKISNELIVEKLKTINLFYKPKIWVYHSLLSFFVNHLNESLMNNYRIPKYSVKPNILQIIDKVENEEYENLERLINDIEKFSEWILNANFNNNSKMYELQKVFKAWQRYKKAKYSNAREYYKIIISHWDSIKGNFEINDDLSIMSTGDKNGTNNNNNTSLKESSNVPKLKKKSFKGSAEMKRLGIDISQLSNNEPEEVKDGRNLRKRKSLLLNHKEDEIDDKNNNGNAGNGQEDSNHRGTVLRARLNRVKFRTNVQNLRKSSRFAKKQ